MKKNIGIFLSLILLLNVFSTIAFASDLQTIDNETNIIEQFNEQISASSIDVNEQMEEIEQKVYCEATIDQAFANDEILVVLSKEQSALKQEYTVSDFPGISLENVYVLYDYYPED